MQYLQFRDKWWLLEIEKNGREINSIDIAKVTKMSLKNILSSIIYWKLILYGGNSLYHICIWKHKTCSQYYSNKSFCTFTLILSSVYPCGFSHTCASLKVWSQCSIGISIHRCELDYCISSWKIPLQTPFHFTIQQKKTQEVACFQTRYIPITWDWLSLSYNSKEV